MDIGVVVPTEVNGVLFVHAFNLVSLFCQILLFTQQV
jgi:hypothetical protein